MSPRPRCAPPAATGSLEHLQAAGGLPSRQIRALADRALAAAAAQQQTLPAERLTAELVRELATEVGTRSRPWESRSVAVDGAKVSR